MHPQLDSLDSLAALTRYEDWLFDHFEDAGDYSLVAAIFAGIDQIPDRWLRTELDVAVTVACSKWAPAAFEAFESQLRGASA